MGIVTVYCVVPVPATGFQLLCVPWEGNPDSSLASPLMRARSVPRLGLRSHALVGTVAGCKRSFHLSYAFFRMYQHVPHAAGSPAYSLMFILFLFNLQGYFPKSETRHLDYMNLSLH